MLESNIIKGYTKKYCKKYLPKKLSRTMIGYTEKDCTIRGLLYLVQRLSQPTGAAPVSLAPARDGWNMSVAKRMAYYGYVFIVVALSTLAVGLYMDSELDEEHSLRMGTPFATFVWSIDVGGIVLICTMAVATAPKRMSLIIRHLNKLHLINSKLDYKPEPQNKQCVTLGIFSLIAAFMFCLDFRALNLETADRHVEKDYLYFYISYYFLAWMILLLEMQYVIVGFQAPDTLQKLNDEIEMIVTKKFKEKAKERYEEYEDWRKSTNIDALKPSERSFYNSRNEPVCDPSAENHLSERAQFHRLLSSHIDILDTAREYNDESALLVVSLLAMTVVHLMVTPYYFAIFIMSSLVETTTLVLQLAWFAFHVIKLMLLVEPGQRMQNEMLRTRLAVSRMFQAVGTSAGDPILQDLDQFYKQVSLHENSLFSAGLCTLKRAIVTSKNGPVTTNYLIPGISTNNTIFNDK